MDIRLSERQRECRDAAQRFADSELAPWAAQIDRNDTTPLSVLAAVQAAGYLGAALPVEWGGGDMDPVSYGLLTEEFGKASSAIRSLLTVHNMSSHAILRFANAAQKERWLPALCAGREIIAFALSEPEVGSAAHSIKTQVEDRGDVYVLDGIKKWVTYGMVAGHFLVFAQCDGKPIALVVDRESEGLSVEAITDVFGARGSMLAQLRFKGVRVGKDCRIGEPGMGITFVANTALDHGRFSVAWGCTGIIRACLDSCLSYTGQRRQGDEKLSNYQLVRRQLADMLVEHTAARALCLRSACLREQRDPRAVMETSLAKYYASKAAIRVANDAVHLHGANGCGPDYPVSRYLRDASVMGIVEGTHEIHQLALAGYAFQRPYLE